MGKNIKNEDVISEGTLHEILLDIKYRLEHLEDIEADNRTLIVKMIKQGNSIVKFLSQIDIETVGLDDMELPSTDKFTKLPINENKIIDSDRIKHIKEVLDEFAAQSGDPDEFYDTIKTQMIGANFNRKDIRPSTMVHFLRTSENINLPIKLNFKEKIFYILK